MKSHPQQYDISFTAIRMDVHRLNLCGMLLLVLFLVISPFKPAAAGQPGKTITKTVVGPPVKADGEPAEPAESWSEVDETLRRTTFLPDDLRWQAPDTQVDGLMPEMSGIKARTDRYLAGLDEQSPFRGLYFRSTAVQDADSGDTDHSYRLEWDLFKNGLYQRKKELEKNHRQKAQQILQMLNDVNQHHLEQRLDGIEFLARAMQFRQAGELADLLADILRRRRVQLEKGYITRDDFNNIRFKYRQAELNKKLFAGRRRTRLDTSLYDLLNCAEFAVLIALEQAQQVAVENAYPLKIQQNLIEQADYADSWSDDLSLILYLEQHDYFNDIQRSNVGFEVKIPIHWDTGRGRLIDQEKRLHENQAAVLKQRIRTNVEKLYDFFTFQQARIRILLLELEKNAQRKAYEQARAKRAIEDLDYTPERSLDQIRMEEIDLRYEAIQARLNLYEILVKITALTHVDHPRNLIAGTQPYFSVR